MIQTMSIRDDSLEIPTKRIVPDSDTSDGELRTWSDCSEETKKDIFSFHSVNELDDLCLSPIEYACSANESDISDLEFLAIGSPASNSDNEMEMDQTPTATEETKQNEMPPTASDIALCPNVNTEYATGTAGVKAIRTTNASPVTYRARYYTNNRQYRIGRFASITEAAAAIKCADAWVHDGPHFGQEQMLSDDLVSPFLFDSSNREGKNKHQNHCAGEGGHDDEMEDPETQSPPRRPMRGSEMPEVPPARASACEPSESVDSSRISNCFPHHHTRWPRGPDTNEGKEVLVAIIHNTASAHCKDCRMASCRALGLTYTHRDRPSRADCML